MKESDVRDREEESPLGLSPQLMAALAGGQLIARPPLELSPADIFPPEETTPRLDLLARALLDQRAVEPYVRTLAVAMAAPAPTAESELRPLLLTLARILRDARAQATRFSKPLASSPQVAEALERLGSLTELMTREAFLEAVSRLYANPSDLGEDIYLCRALLDHPQEAIELARMRHFLTQAVVPDSAPELALDRTIALEQLSFACLVAEGHRLGSMRATFDRFRQRYDAAYLEHHWQYWAEAMNTHAQLLDFAPKAYALRRLNTLSELGPPLGEKALAEYEELPGAIWGCSLQVATALDLGDDARCPECGISMGQEPPWRQAQEVRHRLEKALRQQLQRLSSKAVRQILAGSSEARVEEFLRVVQASQTEALASVLDDELLGFLRRFLVEARVHSLLSPLLAKLQNISPDVSDETVEAVTEEVGRILQDAFGAAQQILPEEARPQLSPGRD